MVSITCFGGVSEIGGNKILPEDGNTRFLFDFGTSFARRYRFFEEYLKPRPGVGLLDMLYMELILPLEGILAAIWQPPAISRAGGGDIPSIGV